MIIINKKKIMKKYVAYLLLIIGSFNLQAQENETVPLDSAIRYGKLENGMTYYIRHNEEPKERASFYFAQNVGAILENDDQNGLAHFLEHMAFNGTEHFKGKAILKFLEKHGVTFGRNINAYTSQDETVYNLSDVPTTKEGLIDSCLLVLNDWSNYLLLSDEEIDNERGVISEEWRTRRNSQFRVRSKQNKALFFGSKYAKRDVIGDLDIIKNFDYNTLRDFYHKWYRTDLQAVIVVGDVDVDAVEKSIINIFSKIPAVENAEKREVFDIPDNNEPLYALASDKEASNYSTALYFKSNAIEAENKSELSYLEGLYVRQMFNMMLSGRLMERLRQENCPYMMSQAQLSNFIRTKDLAILVIVHKEGAWEAAVREAATIVEKVRDYGFTQTELDRTKIAINTRMENLYKMREKKSNDDFAKEYKTHYISNTPAPGIKYEYELVQDLSSRLTLEDFQELAQKFLTDENMVIVASGPEKEDAVFPTNEEVSKVINEVKNAELVAYADAFVDKPLIPNEPVAGTIVNRKEIQNNGFTAIELELSNGVRVLYKHSGIETETIYFNAHSWGGKSILRDDQLADAFVIRDFMGRYGLGDFSANELSKKLTGKIASVGFSIGELNEGLSGKASPKDLEAMFQLLYLHFTNPRFDEKAYKSVHSIVSATLENRKNDVKQAFNDSVALTMADNHPRIKLFNEDLLSKVSFDGIKDVYMDRFANAADFVFTFTGNFDQKTIEAHIVKYIASLPTTDLKEKYVDNGVRAPKESVNNHFLRELETAKSTVYVNFHNKYSNNQKNNIYAQVISKLLAKRYLEEIREKEGGTYGVSVAAMPKERPYNEFQLAFKFDCDPEKADKLKGIALDEIDQLINGKVIESDLEEVKQNLLKNQKENTEKLRYWQLKLYNYAVDGDTGMSDYEYIKFIHSINAKTLVKKAKKFLKNAIKVEVVMSAK